MEHQPRHVELATNGEGPTQEEVGDDTHRQVARVGQLPHEPLEWQLEFPRGPHESDVEVHGGEAVGALASLGEAIDEGEFELDEADVGVSVGGLVDERGVGWGGDDGDS